MTTFFIIGTWHHFHMRSRGFAPQAVHQAYENEIRKVVQAHRVDALADEDCDRHELVGVRPNFSEVLSEELGLPSFRIDASAAQRAADGYGEESGKSQEQLDEYRERLWVDRLGGLAAKFERILFVCGSAHVASMQQRLLQHGDVLVLHDFWEG